MSNSRENRRVDLSVDHSKPDQLPSEAPVRPTRRRVLAVGAAAGAVVLAGCGSGGETASPGQSPGSGGSAGGAGGGSGGGAGGPLVATAKVPVRGGVILDRVKVVVTQPSDGTFEAFSAVCTHQQCLVGLVKDNVISCPCHGSAYSATDGSVRQGPATRPLTKIPIKVEGGEVVEA